MECFLGRRPNLFIIGAAKSGTTSLYEYLAGHPEVFMSPVKEPMYFSPDVQGVTRKRMSHPDGEADYLALFDGARGEKILGEASTRYMVSRAAPRLIRDFDSAARIVATLRNPVDMAHALHFERVAYGMETITDFAKAMEADDDRLAGRRLRGDTTPEYGAYRPNARFGEQLARWFECFDREQVHVLLFDDLVADTQAAFRRLLQFLDVDSSYALESFNAYRRSHRRRGGVIGAVTGGRPARFLSHRLLPALVGRNRGEALRWQYRQSRLARKDQSRAAMPAELRLRLEEEFAPDVARLSEMLGRDLSQLWFGRPASA